MAGARRRSTWLVFGGLALFMALVIYRSFHVASYRCEVCVSFQGREGCGRVESQTESEARMAAVNNACAHVASGVTDSMACERTAPTKVDCTAMN